MEFFKLMLILLLCLAGCKEMNSDELDNGKWVIETFSFLSEHCTGYQSKVIEFPPPPSYYDSTYCIETFELELRYELYKSRAIMLDILKKNTLNIFKANGVSEAMEIGRWYKVSIFFNDKIVRIFRNLNNSNLDIQVSTIQLSYFQALKSYNEVRYSREICDLERFYNGLGLFVVFTDIRNSSLKVVSGYIR